MGMKTAETTAYFNDLTVDLNDEAFFPTQIHERSKENPNDKVAIPCLKRNDSLDDYASLLAAKMLAALKGNIEPL